MISTSTRANHEKIQELIRERMSCNQVEVPASVFDEVDDDETIAKLAEAWSSDPNSDGRRSRHCSDCKPGNVGNVHKR